MEDKEQTGQGQKEAPAPKTPAQLQKEAFDAEEARRAGQTEFDPKVHGVGPSTVEEPDSVKQLFKWAVNEIGSLKARIDRLERGR